MTKYHTQFEEAGQVIGTNLAGWTARGRNTLNTSFAPQYGTPRSYGIKRRYLKMQAGTGSGFVLSNLLTWNTIDSDANRANVELLTHFNYDDATVTQMELWVRESGTTATVVDAGYVARLILSGSLAISRRLTASTETDLASGTASFTFAAGKGYFVRFRANSTAMKLRVWDAALGMAGEPTTWNIDTTDATFSAAGSVGFACRATTAGDVAPWSFLAVATNGDTAVCPRTNAEFATAVASQQFKPNVLFDLAFTGYDSAAAPYTKTVNAYFATRGFTSAEQDTPSRKPYRSWIKQAPTINRQMGADFAGPVSNGYGDLLLTNPRSVARGPGVLDDLLRMRPLRSTAIGYLGDVTWPKHDYRTVIVARLGPPIATAVDEIKFEVTDFSDFLDVDIQTSLFTTGDYINQRKPIFWGQTGGGGSHTVSHIEPPLTDSVNLIYTISDAAILSFDPTVPRCKVYDNQVEIKTAALTNTSVSGNEFTTSANHGMVVNYLVRTPAAGAVTGGLANNTNYWVQSVSAGNKFTLSATRGGAVITLTNTTPIANTFTGYGYTIVNTGPSTIQLAAAPVGRVTISDVLDTASAYTAWDVVGNICARAGLSANYGPIYGSAAGFTWDMAYWQNTQKRSARDVLNDIMGGSLGWYAFTLDGLLVTDAVSLPLSTAVKSFVEGDVKSDREGKKSTLKQVSYIRAKNVINAQVMVAPWFVTGGPFQTGTQAALQLGTYLAALSYGTADKPIDNYPQSTDSDSRFSATYYSTKNRPLFKELYQIPVGIFEFETHLGGLFSSTGPISIGDTIALTHSRLGFKNYSAGTASPDNSGSFDATKVVVCGIETNLKDNVKLRVYRQIPGYYPTTDFN